MKKFGVAVVLLSLSLSAYGLTFFEGFEDGTLDAWYPVYEWNSYPIVGPSADNGAVLPHSGNYLCYQQRNYGQFWEMVQHDFPAQTGTLIAYINPIAFSDDFLFSFAAIGNHGEILRVINGGTAGTELRIVFPGNSNFLPGVTITDHVWHEVKFVIRDNTTTGSRVFWDGVLVADNITGFQDIAGIQFGTSWGSAACAYDDIQFLSQGEDTVTITGQIALEDYAGDLRDALVRIELRQGVDVRTERLRLDVDGNYTIYNVGIGTYDVAAKTYASLQKVVSGVAISLASTEIPLISLINGDTDGDNEVTTSDLATILLNMDQVGD